MRISPIGNFGSDRKDPFYVLFCLVAAAFSILASLQHANIVGFVPTVEIAAQMPFWMTAFFLTMIAWAGLFGLFLKHAAIRIGASFLAAHVLIAALSYLPPLVIQGYFLCFSILGLGFGVKALIERFSSGLVLVFLMALAVLPFLWLTIGWLLFALPHSNYFSAFGAERMPNMVVIDVLHQRAYIQFIHNFGIPSVGINGLGYHHYHWLVGYPISTLAHASGANVMSIHANMLPGFTGPVLVHGVLTGLLIGSRGALHFGCALVALLVIYLAALLSMKAITYGLVFLSPSSAYSLGLFAPLAGMFVYFYSGNIKRLRAWHFAVCAGYLIMVGLAKVNSVFMASMLLGGLWLPFVLIRKTTWLSRAIASLFVGVAAMSTLYLIWEILQHNKIDVPVPSGYIQMIEGLSTEAQDAIKDDVQNSLIFQKSGKGAITDYERISFWQTLPGFIAIVATVLLPLSWLVPSKNRRNRVYLLVLLAFVFSALFIIQRTFIGLPRPTQVIYILTPALVLGVICFGQAAGALLMPLTIFPKRRFGKFMGSSVALVTLLIVLVISFGSLGHVTDRVAGAAASRATQTLGALANENGRRVIAQLGFQRAQSWGFGKQSSWPTKSANYWKVWENRPLKQIQKRLSPISALNRHTAVFIPAGHEFWEISQTGDIQASMFWVQAHTGMPLYRGKISNPGAASLSFGGRGISDFSFASGALISLTSNVHCWSRFENFTIIDLQGNEIKQC